MKKLLITIICLFSLTGCNSSIYSKYEVSSNNKIDTEKYETYQELTYEDYTEKINKKESFIILLYQTGCSHCESFEPKLNRIIKYYNLSIYALNLANLSDKEYEIVKNKTFISGTPTTVYIENGSYKSKIVGDKDEQTIIDFLVDSDYLEEK